MSDLREKVEVALVPYLAQLQRRHLDDAVDAVIAIARPAIIEECARVVEALRGDALFSDSGGADFIATAIRALAEKKESLYE